MRNASSLLLCLSLGLACGKSGGTATPVVAAVPDEVDATPSADPDQPPDGPRFWVARGGLHAYDLDGTKVAALGDRGDLARRLSDGRVVVVEDSTLGARLSVLDAQGTPTLELELPTVFDGESCSMQINALEQEPFEGLSMQSDRDFSINAKGTHACVTLLDRNENMADYSVDLAIDLATGKVESHVGYEPHDRCPETSLAACKDLGQETTWTEGIEAAAATRWTHAYDEKTGVLSRAGKAVRELCMPKDQRGVDWQPEYGCVFVEEVSSSGRWLLVSAEYDVGGDYIYRQLYVLDLETAALSTMVCESEAACTMEAVAPELLFVGDEPVGYTVVGESEVGSLPGDRFWIEGKLVIPGDGKVVAIGGTRVLSAG